MKTIAQIIGGAQALLNISFDLQGCFEEYLSDEHKTFLHMLRAEEQIPPLIRLYAGTGRILYEYGPFMRSFLAMRYFGIEKVSRLIQRLKGEPNLRLLCGFAKVPGKAAFSRMFAFLSGQEGLLEKPLEGIVAVAHKAPEKDKGTEKDRGLAVYHVNRDSTAIPAREKVMKKPREKAPEAGKTAQKQPETPERTDGHRKAGETGREDIP